MTDSTAMITSPSIAGCMHKIRGVNLALNLSPQQFELLRKRVKTGEARLRLNLNWDEYQRSDVLQKHVGSYGFYKRTSLERQIFIKCIAHSYLTL